MTKFLIYDSRYNTNPDETMVLAVCDTIEEAEESKDEYGDNCVVVEEEIKEGEKVEN
jgi:hypothetical protein